MRKESNINIVSSSQIGLVRKSNQDNMIDLKNYQQNIYAFLVLDGVGGSNAGDVASASVVQLFSQQFDILPWINSLQQLKEWSLNAMRKVNDKLYQMAHRDNQFHGMSTTAVLVILSEFGDFYINIGDSRLYMLDENNQLTQLSVDHSLVNDLLMMGQITQEQAQSHPMRHAVTNAVGIYQNLRADLNDILLPYKSLLLCTDGLSGYVKHEVIQQILTKNISLDDKKKELNKAVLDTGAFDNFTFILLEVSE